MRVLSEGKVTEREINEVAWQSHALLRRVLHTMLASAGRKSGS